MLSISKTQSRIVEFLLRRFSSSFTIRKTAQELKISPAGAHKAVKDLEKDGILVTERIGASLVCKVNLQNPVAEHLSAMLLAEPDEKPSYVAGLRKGAKAAILAGKKLLVVADQHVEPPKELSVSFLSETELILNLLKKDPTTVEFIVTGTVLFGESTIVRAVKNRGIP